MACSLFHSPQVADSPDSRSLMSSSARIDELRKKFDENPRRYFAPLANEYRKVGDFDQAIFICQEYLPQQPGHMSGHIVFGQALFEAKRLPEARTVFETALTLDPENLIALRHLADISRDLGETTAARGWYERVLQADPRNEEIAAIMSSMPAAGSPATTGIPPAPPPPPPPPARLSGELSRGASSEAPAPEKLTLDEAPTVEVNVTPEPSTLEGFETTSHEGLLDIPSGGMLGLEPTAAPSQTPTPSRLPPRRKASTRSLSTISLPTSGAAVSAAASRRHGRRKASPRADCSISTRSIWVAELLPDTGAAPRRSGDGLCNAAC